MKLLTIYRKVKDQKKLFYLGAWCLQNHKKIKINQPKIIPHPWRDHKIKKKDLGYIKKKYFFFIKILTKELNIIHNTSYPIRYWEIIVGPWLMEFIGLSFEHYRHLKELKKYKIKEHLGHKFIKTDNFKDMQSFWNIRFENQFRYNLFFKIIRILYPKINYKKMKPPFYKKFSEKIKPQSNYLNTLFKNLKKNIINMSVYQFDTSYFNFPTKLLLSFILFPINFLSFPDQIKLKKNKNNIREYFLKNLKFKNKSFDHIFIEILKNFIPYSYLENYKEIDMVTSSMGKKNKIIFSANSFVTNDYFKVWAARRYLEGSKIFFSDHGGGFRRKFLVYEMFGKRISDKFFQFDNFVNTKSIFFNPLIKFNYKSLFARFFTKKKILFITRDRAWYPIRAQAEEDGYDIMNTFKMVNLVCENLKKEKIDFIIRPLTYKKNYINIYELFKQKYPKNLSIFVKNKKYDFYKDIYKSNLTIVTYPMTSFVKSIACNRPTICLFEKNQFIFEECFSKIIRKMENNNLIFYDPILLSKFLSSNYNQINEWWNSNKIKIIKKDLNKIFLKNNKIDNLIKIVKV